MDPIYLCPGCGFEMTGVLPNNGGYPCPNCGHREPSVTEQIEEALGMQSPDVPPISGAGLNITTGAPMWSPPAAPPATGANVMTKGSFLSALYNIWGMKGKKP